MIMVIAVDFDGTIVEHKYPHIGKEIPFAIIDDRSLGGLPDWGEIYEVIHKGYSYRDYMKEIYKIKKTENQSLWRKFFCNILHKD